VGSVLQAVAPGVIVGMVDRAIQVGYMAALKEIQSGMLDEDILERRPDFTAPRLAPRAFVERAVGGWAGRILEPEVSGGLKDSYRTPSDLPVDN
jgi:hypothetical protein